MEVESGEQRRRKARRKFGNIEKTEYFGLESLPQSQKKDAAKHPLFLALLAVYKKYVRGTQPFIRKQRLIY